MRLLKKILAWAAFAVLVIALVGINALLVWVTTGPRALSQAVPYVEAALTPEDGSRRVAVGEVWLVWDGWRHPFDIRLKRIEVFSRGGERFASFPEISLDPALLPLLAGKFEPKAVTLHHPVMRLVKDKDGKIRLGLQGVEDKAPQPEENDGIPLAGIMGFLVQGSGDPALAHLDEIAIEGGELALVSPSGDVSLSAQQLDFTVTRGLKDANLFAQGLVRQKAGDALVKLWLQVDKQNLAGKGSIELQRLVPAALAPLVEAPSWQEAAAGFNFPVTANAQFTLGENATLSSLNYVVDGGLGEITNDSLAGPVPVTSLHAEGSLAGETRFTAEHFAFVTGEMQIAGSGQVALLPEGTGIDASLTVKHAVAGDVGRFWPVSLAPQSRLWIVENIREGRIPVASVTAHIAPGDLQLPELPAQDIDAVIRIENATVRALPQHEPLRGVTGLVRVNAKTLAADIAQAQGYSETTMTNGKLAIENLNVENPRIDLTFDVTTAARDVAQFLSLPPVEKAARLKLDPQTAQGGASGHAKLGFYFFAPKDANGRPREDMGVDYDIAANVSAVTLPGFMGRFDIEKAQGAAAVDNNGLRFQGGGTVNGVAADAEIKYVFVPQGGYDTFMKVSTTAPLEALKRFGYPELPYITGKAAMQGEIKIGAAGEALEGDFDLKDASIAAENFPWNKPLGEPAALSLALRTNEKGMEIPRFSFKGAGLTTKGAAAFTPDYSGLKYVRLENLQWGQDDLSFAYERLSPNSYKISVRGNSVDVSPWLKGGGSSFRLSDFPHIDLESDMGRVILDEGRELHTLRGYLRCTQAYCVQADLRGTAEDTPFSVAIGGDPRVLRITAANGGSFLHALNIYDNMRGGSMLIAGMYDDGQPARPLKGKLTVGEHVIEGAPTLAQLLTLASLTGFVDTLRGHGIAFTRLDAPFTVNKDVITVEDAHTYGPAIGMNLGGRISFPGEKLDMKGTVVPSYTLNTVLGNVPILGDIITGGGEGIIGARFSVGGTADEPNLSVNPLSILTPGILRNIFNIFDKPEKKEEIPPPPILQETQPEEQTP